MLEGFEPLEVEAGDGLTLRGRIGGPEEGPPLLLLHGYPQTHAMWFAVAPELAKANRVVMLDLPGYGASDAPPLTGDHVPYSKRAWALLFIEAMKRLGHKQFALAGHDRGARAAYRLALDHPDTVTRLALLDILPTVTMWEMANANFAINTFHWGFLAQPAPFPEKMIEGDPIRFMDHCMAKWAGEGFAFDQDAMRLYHDAFCELSVIRASCEDYRAGATVDADIDRESRDGGQTYPGLALLVWGAKNFGSDVNAICDAWRMFLSDPHGVALDCGHFVAEEKPAETAAALRQFFETA